MTRVSSGAKKSGPPAHANKFAFIHNRNSKLTRLILSMPISGMCPACQEVIEWRKKFRKYKPLTVAKKCVKCGEKKVKEAYHTVCNPCAAQDKVCAKCLQAHTSNNNMNEGGDPAEVPHSISSDTIAENIVETLEILSVSSNVG